MGTFAVPTYGTGDDCWNFYMNRRKCECLEPDRGRIDCNWVYPKRGQNLCRRRCIPESHCGCSCSPKGCKPRKEKYSWEQTETTIRDEGWSDVENEKSKHSRSHRREKSCGGCGGKKEYRAFGCDRGCGCESTGCGGCPFPDFSWTGARLPYTPLLNDPRFPLLFAIVEYLCEFPNALRCIGPCRYDRRRTPEAIHQVLSERYPRWRYSLPEVEQALRWGRTTLGFLRGCCSQSGNSRRREPCSSHPTCVSYTINTCCDLKARHPLNAYLEQACLQCSRPILPTNHNYCCQDKEVCYRNIVSTPQPTRFPRGCSSSTTTQ